MAAQAWSTAEMSTHGADVAMAGNSDEGGAPAPAPFNGVVWELEVRIHLCRYTI